MVLTSAATLLASPLEQDNAASKAPAKGNHFAIAYRAASPNSKVEAVPPSPPSELSGLGESIVRRLKKQGLLQVPTLDVQCCTVQMTLMDPKSPADSGGKQKSIRVTVMDIDNQPLYTKEFATTKAGEDLTDSLFADPKFLQLFHAH